MAAVPFVHVSHLTRRNITQRPEYEALVGSWFEKAALWPNMYGLDAFRYATMQSAYLPPTWAAAILPHITSDNGHLKQDKIRAIFNWVISDPVLLERARMYVPKINRADDDAVRVHVKPCVFQESALMGTGDYAKTHLYSAVLMVAVEAIQDGANPIVGMGRLPISDVAHRQLKDLCKALDIDPVLAGNHIVATEADRWQFNGERASKQIGLELDADLHERLVDGAPRPGRYVASVVRDLVTRGAPLARPDEIGQPQPASVRRVRVQAWVTAEDHASLARLALRRGETMQSLVERELASQLAFSVPALSNKRKMASVRRHVVPIAKASTISPTNWRNRGQLIAAGVRRMALMDPEALRDVLCRQGEVSRDNRSLIPVDPETSQLLKDLSTRHGIAVSRVGTVAFNIGCETALDSSIGASL